MSPIKKTRMTNYRWVICSVLFFAVMINYMDRQVLSLTWKDFIVPEFAWSESDYADITAFFSIVYAIGMLGAGWLVDRIGAKKGLTVAICLWSFGAIMHGFCGILTAGWITGDWLVGFTDAKETLYDYGVKGLPITTVSVYLFMICRFVLAIGQAGCFPAAISATAQYFPKKDTAFAISVFNNGASVGALAAPISIPMLANKFGWEMAYVIVGLFGYIWVLAWLLMYKNPKENGRVNMSELRYIRQDDYTDNEDNRKTIGVLQCLKYRKTWALIIGKFMTDGVWWFFLFWSPVYILEFHDYTPDSPMGMAMIFVIYLISLLSIAGGYLPTFFVSRYATDPYTSRMRAMLIFAVVQMVGVFALPLGGISPWLLVVVIGVQGASHQSWSANLFAMVGDFFPKHSVGTITGVVGFAGGLSAYLVMKQTTWLFQYAAESSNSFAFLGYYGKQAAYMAVFCTFAFMYLVGWGIMRFLAPNRKQPGSEAVTPPPPSNSLSPLPKAGKQALM